MIRPPTIIRLRFKNEHQGFGLWLPLFLVLPFVLLLALIIAPLVLVAAVILWYTGWGRAILLIGPAIYRCFCALRGLKIDVKQGQEHVYISIV